MKGKHLITPLLHILCIYREGEGYAYFCRMKFIKQLFFVVFLFSSRFVAVCIKKHKHKKWVYTKQINKIESQ